MGPNAKKLLTMRMSQLAIPDGGGFRDAIEFLTNRERVSTAAREAQEWVELAIAAVKAAPDNHFGNDDERIAGEILRLIELKKRSGRNG